MTPLRTAPILLLLLSYSGPGLAQETPAPVEAPAEVPDVAVAGFVYEPAGRRDPFLSLFRPPGMIGEDPNGARGSGVRGLGVDEVALKGVLQSPEGFVALVEGVDSRTYLLRVGDSLFDGTIEAITGQDMMILQRVSDPLLTETQREVRKTLRQTEEARP